MNEREFTAQMQRLDSQFGKLGDERVRMILREVKDLPGEWLKRTVDEFCFSCDRMPLGEKWREKIAQERERQHQIEKRQESKKEENFQSKYSPVDINTILKEAKRRVQGGMTDQDFECFKKMLTPPGGFNCSICEDQKVYWDGKGNTVCQCKK